MQKISVVIVCKNEADIIAATLQSFAGLTDDILVYDNGSTDGTQKKIKDCGARLAEGSWEGFGKTKSKANALARYDWILSLDSDEAIDEELKQNLLGLTLDNDKVVYEMKFKNYLGDRWLRFGEWGGDRHIRLFNKKIISWNDAAVHESLLMPETVKIITVKGYVLHKTAASLKEYKSKMQRYAELNAQKYFKQGKRTGSLQMIFSAAFSFIKNYLFKLGFLDGIPGFHCARINAWYTFLKYKKLNELTGAN